MESPSHLTAFLLGTYLDKTWSQYREPVHNINLSPSHEPEIDLASRPSFAERRHLLPTITAEANLNECYNRRGERQVQAGNRITLGRNQHNVPNPIQNNPLVGTRIHLSRKMSKTKELRDQYSLKDARFGYRTMPTSLANYSSGYLNFSDITSEYSFSSRSNSTDSGATLPQRSVPTPTAYWCVNDSAASRAAVTVFAHKPSKARKGNKDQQSKLNIFHHPNFQCIPAEDEESNTTPAENVVNSSNEGMGEKVGAAIDRKSTDTGRRAPRTRLTQSSRPSSIDCKDGHKSDTDPIFLELDKSNKSLLGAEETLLSGDQDQLNDITCNLSKTMASNKVMTDKVIGYPEKEAACSDNTSKTNKDNKSMKKRETSNFNDPNILPRNEKEQVVHSEPLDSVAIHPLCDEHEFKINSVLHDKISSDDESGSISLSPSQSTPSLTSIPNENTTGCNEELNDNISDLKLKTNMDLGSDNGAKQYHETCLPKLKSKRDWKRKDNDRNQSSDLLKRANTKKEGKPEKRRTKETTEKVVTRSETIKWLAKPPSQSEINLGCMFYEPCVIPKPQPPVSKLKTKKQPNFQRLSALSESRALTRNKPINHIFGERIVSSNASKKFAKEGHLVLKTPETPVTVFLVNIDLGTSDHKSKIENLEPIPLTINQTASNTPRKDLKAQASVSKSCTRNKNLPYTALSQSLISARYHKPYKDPYHEFVNCVQKCNVEPWEGWSEKAGKNEKDLLLPDLDIQKQKTDSHGICHQKDSKEAKELSFSTENQGSKQIASSPTLSNDESLTYKINSNFRFNYKNDSSTSLQCDKDNKVGKSLVQPHLCSKTFQHDLFDQYLNCNDKVPGPLRDGQMPQISQDEDSTVFIFKNRSPSPRLYYRKCNNSPLLPIIEEEDNYEDNSGALKVPLDSASEEDREVKDREEDLSVRPVDQEHNQNALSKSNHVRENNMGSVSIINDLQVEEGAALVNIEIEHHEIQSVHNVLNNRCASSASEPRNTTGEDVLNSKPLDGCTRNICPYLTMEDGDFTKNSLYRSGLTNHPGSQAKPFTQRQARKARKQENKKYSIHTLKPYTGLSPIGPLKSSFLEALEKQPNVIFDMRYKRNTEGKDGSFFCIRGHSVRRAPRGTHLMEQPPTLEEPLLVHEQSFNKVNHFYHLCGRCLSMEMEEQALERTPVPTPVSTLELKQLQGSWDLMVDTSEGIANALC